MNCRLVLEYLYAGEFIPFNRKPQHIRKNCAHLLTKGILFICIDEIFVKTLIY